MKRWVSLLAIFMVLAAGSLSTVSAQDSASPEAGEGASAAIIYGSDGQPEGEITVSSISDPFEDFDPSFAPQRGFHFVMAIVTITATADHAIEASSYGFYIVDTEGFSYSITYLYRPTESTDAIPDFLGGPVEPGQSMSGAIFFEVLDGTTAGLLFYQPTYDRLITAADLRDEPVGEGDPGDFLGCDGAATAWISVDGVVSPLEDYASPPQRGFEFVGVSVTIENTGSQPFEIDPYDFAIVDAEGFVYNNYGVFRTEEGEASEPSLQYSTELAAGATISGLVSFQVLAGTELGLIYFAPSSDRHVRLAEYSEGQAPKPSGTPPAVTRTDPGEEVTPVTEDTPEVTGTTPGCEGVIDWAEASLININNWTDLFIAVAGVVDGLDLDPEVARDAADTVEDIAGAQRDLDVPDVAEAANDVLIDLYDQTAEAVEALADALEADDAAGIAEAIGMLKTVGGLTDEGGALDTVLIALSDTCPEIESVG